MTNELTLEKALDRMQRVLEGWEGKENDPNQLAAALRLVIEAAKRPTALSGEERRVLEAMQKATDPPPHSEREQYDALTAALSLASPFTEEEWAEIKELVDSAVAGMVRGVAQMGGPEKAYPLARLLRSIEAKLDAMLAQSSPGE